MRPAALEGRKMMIGLLIQDQVFEQDIRELLMSFYPGESYAHRVQEEVEFYVETELKDGQIGVFIWEKPENTSGAASVSDSDRLRQAPDGLEGWTLTAGRREPSDLSDRAGSKNVIKKMFYQMLTERTGKEQPWGSLTGIRPTKIALSRLEEGWSEEEIRSFMKGTYLASDEKIDLSIEIAARERELLKPLDYARGYSLYVGIPFCPTTCLYCSFTSYPISKWKGRTGEYLQALFRELEYTADQMKGRPLDTIYIGGGTPTSLSAEDLDCLLTRLEELFDTKHALEFTVEAGRPDSITEEKLQVLKHHNISRISINPQTMNQKTLDLIGRHHTVEQVKDTFRMARRLGFDNINMDLIMGLPGETIEDVEHTLQEIEALKPDSLTVHALAVKRAARLNLFREEYGAFRATDTARMIELSEASARRLGMEPYYLYRQKNMAGNFENVGYSQPGKACIYNILIMEELQTIAACGAGTTTKVVYHEENRRERCENVKEAALYIEKIEEMIDRKRALLEE